MAVVGVISRTPRLELSEWAGVIYEMPMLGRLGSVEVVNPFTQEREVREIDATTAHITAEGRLLGAIEPSPEFADDGELLVYSAQENLDEVRNAVAAVARRLGASLLWLPDVEG